MYFYVRSEDLDAIVLQGYTTSTANFPATWAAFNPTIASQDSAARFGSLPNGYQIINSQVGDQIAFYRYPNYLPSVFTSLDSKKQTFSLGDFFTLTGPVAPATLFTGPVNVVNGQNDFIFCSSDCEFPSEHGKVALDSLFPAAASSSVSFVIPGTGHAINAHTTASQTYSQMLGFLKGNEL
jgi:hypothetical protein